jgi:hypothetical protein
MLAMTSLMLGLGMLCIAVAGLTTRRLTGCVCNGLLAISNTLMGVSNALMGHTAWLCVNAAAAAMSAWGWWHSGGGDGTRRRLKSWARRFQGVRRTAPQAA